MERSPESTIQVPWTQDDFDVTRIMLELGRISNEEYQTLPLFTKKTVTIAEITEFCKPCDYYGKNSFCERLELSEQTRNAARKWCGWASVNNRMVNMTSSGPQPKNSPLSWLYPKTLECHQMF